MINCWQHEYMSVCLCEQIRQHNSITTVQDAIMKLYSGAAGIKMKAEFKDGCGPTHEYTEC